MKFYYIPQIFLLSLYTNLVYFAVILEMFFTKSAAKF